MRHFLANLATYTIGAMLLVGAALFGWMRSAQLALSNEETLLARYQPEPAHEFRWRELGERSYVSNCANCHGREGEGWDQYPPLDRVPALLAGEGGRGYLIDLHLYGLASERWGAPMPPMGHMHDVELAAVLNHVLTRFGNADRMEPGDSLFHPGEVAARRGRGLRPHEVDVARPRPDRRGASSP